MKKEPAIEAIEAADKELAKVGLPTYTQLINQAQQLSAHAATVTKLTSGNATSGPGGRLHFVGTDC